MMHKKLPSDVDMMWPTLQALSHLGGSGTNTEIFKFLTDTFKFTEEDLGILSANTNVPSLPWGAAWSRTRLRNLNLINNPKRGIWTLTQQGEQIIKQGENAFNNIAKSANKGRKGNNFKPEDNNHNLDENSNDEAWQESLLQTLYNLNPYDFEKLCQNLLRVAGFKEVRVTSKSGDGGMDGYGTLQLNLVSFKVAFQAKRYKGSVGSPDVQKVRGALNSRKERAEKGLIITTGTFTQDAREEAAELPSIDLIDGEALCQLCKQYNLGVETKMVEQVTIQKEFFDNLS